MLRSSILAILISSASLFGALNCNDAGDILSYNGHYYVITAQKMDFPTAKAAAEASSGYLAIPDSQGENDFLKSLVPGNGAVWIGIYDKGTQMSGTTSRFTTIKDQAISYSNWEYGQPDNAVLEGDIINGQQLVSPLGEHWGAMRHTGQWIDSGNHAQSYNPVKFQAIYEFDTKPQCSTATNDTETQLVDPSTGLWCTDGITFGQCITTTDYTAKTGSSYTYAATTTTAFGWDNCEGGSRTFTNASNYCSSKGMRLPVYWNEAKAGGGNVPSCSSGWTWTSTAGSLWANLWSGTNTNYGRIIQNEDGVDYYQTRCVGNTTTYSCRNGGTLSGSMCTVNTLACPTGYTETTGAETAKGECKKELPPSCSIGSYSCTTTTQENLDTTVGATDGNNAGWRADGTCAGQINIFSGKDYRCRSDDMFFGLTGGGCCDKDKVGFGLVQCKAEEKLLAKRAKSNLCHEVGEYCSKKISLGFTKICVQHKKSSCCFGDILSRILNEQGRAQLGKTWGSPNSPQCRGFTPEEFQKIDFSKVDLSEFINTLTPPSTSSISNSVSESIINKFK